MLVTITAHGNATHPATDLGFVLAKHPDRLQRFDVSNGFAWVFYPEATPERCTAALVVELDALSLSRRDERVSWALEPYVNDRLYVASSMLATALSKVFSTAMSGRATGPDAERLAGTEMALEIMLPALPVRGPVDLVERLFTPLGWTSTIVEHALDDSRPDWGRARAVSVTLSGTHTVAEMLSHLYVLLPVLDGRKHYFTTDDEATKLLRVADAWLADHTERDMIVGRYLPRQRDLARSTLKGLDALKEAELTVDPEPHAPSLASDGEPLDVSAGSEDAPAATHDGTMSIDEEPQDRPLAESLTETSPSGEVLSPVTRPTKTLYQHRVDAVTSVLLAQNAARIVDLGCGEAKFLAELAREPSFTELVGVDVSATALSIASRRLKRKGLTPLSSEHAQGRIRLVHASVVYGDDRLAGFDAALAIEVIEHLEEFRLPSFTHALLGVTRPGVAVVTTPNREYNVLYEKMCKNGLRHPDHRFEFDRAEFEAWATMAAALYGYTVSCAQVGELDGELGAPSQMAVFTAENGTLR